MSDTGAVKRVILHVDMDAFYASVEQRDHPEWKGRPVIVGAPRDRRGVVAACSYEARVFGVHSAMPSREAARRCPDAVFVPPRMARYAEVSRQVFAIFNRFTPLVEPLSVDEAFLDVTGARRLFGTGPVMAAKIREAIRTELALTASVGVAPNKFLAKLASDMNKPDGVTVVPERPEAIRAFLAPLPVGRLWGVGKVAGGVLVRAGFHTIGDLQQADPARLAGLLGATTAEALRRLSCGEDAREVQTEWEEKSISREHTFDQDVADRDTVRGVLLDLVEDVGRQVRAAGHAAGLARLKLRWADFQTLTRQAPLAPACCDDFSLRAAALELFDRIPLTRRVRLIGFGVSKFNAGRRDELPLFDLKDAAVERKARLSRVVDDVRNRFGDQSIARGSQGGTRTPVRTSRGL